MGRVTDCLIRHRAIIFLLLFIVTTVPGSTQSVSDDARKLYDQAMVSKNPTQKVRLLKRALVRSPQFVDARLELAITHYEAHEYEEAKAQFDTTLNYNVRNAFVWYHKGLTHRKLGESESALKSLKRAVNLREDIPQFHISLGEFYFDDDQHREALRAFDRAVAVSLQQENSEAAATAWYRKGQAHEVMGDTNNALRSYQRALKLRPDFPAADYANRRLAAQPKLVTWYQAADSAAAQENWTQSLKYLQQIIEIDSTFRDAPDRIRWVEARRKAESLIDSALVLKKENVALDSVFALLQQARDLAPEKAAYIDSIISKSEKETKAARKFAEKEKPSEQLAEQPQESQSVKAKSTPSEKKPTSRFVEHRCCKSGGTLTGYNWGRGISRNAQRSHCRIGGLLSDRLGNRHYSYLRQCGLYFSSFEKEIPGHHQIFRGDPDRAALRVA